MRAISNFIFDSLQQMDREATGITYYRGHWFPTGLRSYAKHRKPDLEPNPQLRQRFRTEDAWADRLDELHRDKRDIVDDVCVRPPYPYGAEEYPYGAEEADLRVRLEADLRVRLADGRMVWNEMKLAKKYDRYITTNYEKIMFIISI
jgi:hypothetical protein